VRLTVHHDPRSVAAAKLSGSISLYVRRASKYNKRDREAIAVATRPLTIHVWEHANANAHVITASVEFHTRFGEAQSLLDNIVRLSPVGSAVPDPISVRVQLLLVGHHVDTAIWELARC